MSRESIQKIKETEARAEEIIEDAKREAQRMIEEATAAGKLFCEKNENVSRASIEVTLTELRERSTALSERMVAEAQEEAEKIKEAAALRRRSAEKIVIGRLMSKCR